MVRALIAAAIVTGSIALATLPAAAEPVSRAVRYADLDLTSQAGRDGLDRRVTNAVRQMCGAMPELALDQRANVRACRTSAQNDARTQVARLIESRRQLAAGQAPRVLASR